LPKFFISDGFPSGPVTLSILSPGFNIAKSLVVLPTSWKANETVPLEASYPEIVKGMRSPVFPCITIRNCPACD
jgi:hypothetical protein